jgi:hypothetical protein
MKPQQSLKDKLNQGERERLSGLLKTCQAAQRFKSRTQHLLE